MEVALIGFLFVMYLVIRYYVVDHDTPADKDRKRFQKGIDRGQPPAVESLGPRIHAAHPLPYPSF